MPFVFRLEMSLKTFVLTTVLIIALAVLGGCKSPNPNTPSPLPPPDNGGDPAPAPAEPCPKRVYESDDGHFRMTINLMPECGSTLQVGSTPDMSVTWWQDFLDEAIIQVLVSNDEVNLVADPLVDSGIHRPFNRIGIWKSEPLKKGESRTISIGRGFGTWFNPGIDPRLSEVIYLAVVVDAARGFAKWISPDTCTPSPWLECNKRQFTVYTNWKISGGGSTVTVTE
ncbi:MAG: hypothetical protein HYX22_01865 [Candidatus Yanofskybacteria bacterium]|nr:hypothetical protein [Candidatus Yanofskybacteria bacterium]